MTYGWAAPDVAYAMGRYELADDEALRRRGPLAGLRVLEPLPLEPLHVHLPTTGYHRCTVNGGQVRYEPDGSWRVVVASARSRASELALDGRATGTALLWFRWFLPADVPGKAAQRARGREHSRRSTVPQ